MTKEQAIERMYDLINTCNVGIERHGTYDDLFQKDKEAIETVLSMLKENSYDEEKKLKAEIKQLKEDCKNLDKQAQQYFETTIIQSKQFNEELEKKDKMIYKMIDSFIDMGFGFEYCNNDSRCISDCDKCIKQYFERKSEQF